MGKDRRIKMLKWVFGRGIDIDIELDGKRCGIKKTKGCGDR